MMRRLILAMAAGMVLALAAVAVDAYRLHLPVGLRIASGRAATETAFGPTSGANGPCLAMSRTIREDSPALADIDAGRLALLSLSSCRDEILLSRGAVAPVRISADGRWVGSGGAVVTPVDGGQVQRPLGPDVFDDASTYTWTWSPSGQRLVGVTTGGAVVLGAPGQQPRMLTANGFGATQVLFAGAEEVVVVRGSNSIWELGTGAAPSPRLIYRDPSAQAQLTLAAALNGSVVFWRQPFASASTAADGDPVLRVDVRSGRVSGLASGVLLGPGFISPCGRGLVIAAGGGRYATLGKAITVVSADWHSTIVATGVSPSCSADGRTVAYAQGNSDLGAAFGTERRQIWVERLEPLATDFMPLDRSRVPAGALTVEWQHAVDAAPAHGPGGDEPILSPDGRVVLWVESESEQLDAAAGPSSQGALRAALVGDPASRTGPLAALGSASDYYGTWTWPQTFVARG